MQRLPTLLQFSQRPLSALMPTFSADDADPRGANAQDARIDAGTSFKGAKDKACTACPTPAP